MEMSDTVKPLTSFLIEDILSVKDGTISNGKRCSQKMERCPQWREGSEDLSEPLCPQGTAFEVQTGEILQAFNSRNVVNRPPNGLCGYDFYFQNNVFRR